MKKVISILSVLNVRICLLFFLFLLLSFSRLAAQENPVPLFQAKGFENLRSCEQGDTLILAYENVAWRNEADGLISALDLLRQSRVDRDVILVLLEKDVAKLAVTVPRQIISEAVQNKKYTAASVRALSFSTHAAKYSRMLRSSTRTAPAAGRTDLVVYPHFRIQNVSLDKIWELQLGLDPAVELQLWKGASFVGQVQIPIYNDIMDREARYVRTGVVALTQEFAFRKGWSLHLGGGLFTNKRQGILSKVSYVTPGGALQAAFQLGLTGAIYWDNGKCTAYSWSKINAIGSLSYFTNWQSLELKVQGGRYVYGDYGVRFDLLRRFKNVGIGLFATYIAGDGSCGFNFSVPIGLRYYKRKGYLRAMTAPYYAFEFNEKVGGKYNQNRAGWSFTDQPDKGYVQDCFNPRYLRNALLSVFGR
ncbi:MAG: YjbH domain-containing protein [Bacteroidales bacterium]